MQSQAHSVGSPVWFELATSDQTAAKAFYGHVFGWQAEDVPMSDQPGLYTLFKLDGDEVAAAYSLMPDQLEQGIPPTWYTYFRVEDCDASAALAERLGGSVVVPPLDVEAMLRIAVLQDPEGATFCIAQLKSHPGVGRIRQPGCITWVELATRDLSRAEAFYRELLGWQLTQHPGAPAPYKIAATADGQIGGMMQMTADWGDMPSHWSIYLQVTDVDQTLIEGQQAGGEICVPAFDAPGVGRIARLNDPAGAGFYLISFPAQ
ncbi:VOC family protein [Pseudomarimonas arenosa]|uniref:VOC family protein n=1 Tax=Pseudomarimonas arenosa TaxID=2774145 RepID=A0AAW3ZPV6_9GAMM|nr:VOC family protein [Pseudomarimonas arenosa]MBD8527753.1 VOC family protein [Pseudomarimonas arenosa]